MAGRYFNKITLHYLPDGRLVKFDSQAEYKRYIFLCALEKDNTIEDVKRQISFDLGSCKYIADFTYKYKGNYIVEDVKNHILRCSKTFLKKEKLMKNIYGISINIVPFRDVCYMNIHTLDVNVQQSFL